MYILGGFPRVVWLVSWQGCWFCRLWAMALDQARIVGQGAFEGGLWRRNISLTNFSLKLREGLASHKKKIRG